MALCHILRSPTGGRILPGVDMVARRMELDLADLRGRPAAPLSARVTRELEEGDLTALSERETRPWKLGKIKARHHSLARALAAGMSPADASIVSGYAHGTVTLLMRDPTFLNLVEFYRADQAKVYNQLHEQMLALGIDTVEELHRRLEDEPEKLGSSLLLSILEKVADRTGNAPKTAASPTVNVHFNLANRLEEARRRIEPPKGAEVESVIDLEANK